VILDYNITVQKYFLAAVIPLLLVLFLMPAYLKYVRRKSFGQQIRELGPESHQEKAGIPTTGGFVVFLAVMVSLLIFYSGGLEKVVVLAVLAINALLGFSDDYLSIKKSRSLGLKARDKILIQGASGLLLGFFLFFQGRTAILWPFSPAASELGWLIIPFSLLVLMGSSNAVNLSDGLDGLAGGLSFISFIFFIPLLLVTGHHELLVLAAAGAGGCLGFLWYNIHPARIFMGDTGSLFLGSLLAVLGLISGSALYLLLLGAVFVLETLSVIIQVSYFKLTGGRRVFLMSPLHHHFELKGWSETLVTGRFYILQIIAGLVGLLASWPLWS